MIAKIVDEFYFGSWIFGGFIGLLFGLTLINLSIFLAEVSHIDYPTLTESRYMVKKFAMNYFLPQNFQFYIEKYNWN